MSFSERQSRSLVSRHLKKNVVRLECLWEEEKSGSAASECSLARSLVLWQMNCGRRGLAWMVNDPYRRWVSEIMLQQTQVSVVQGYYARFLAAFPTVSELAAADDEAVMALWSGLGYYTRAVNMIKAARSVMRDFNGVFPQRSQELVKLPGIGPSTAAAIASFCSGEARAIFDGNVKRVLARVAASDLPVNTATGESAVRDFAQRLIERLCAEAGDVARQVQEQEAALAPEAHTPLAGRFNQAMMDLGAMLCTRTKPACMLCPIRQWCRAAAQGTVLSYPVKKPARTRGSREMHLALCRDAQGRILLQKRDAAGIWPGLWCLPSLEDFAAAAQEGMRTAKQGEGGRGPAVLFHALTHLDLRIVIHRISAGADALPPRTSYFRPEDLESLALPAPIKTFLQSLG